MKLLLETTSKNRTDEHNALRGMATAKVHTFSRINNSTYPFLNLLSPLPYAQDQEYKHMKPAMRKRCLKRIDNDNLTAKAHKNPLLYSTKKLVHGNFETLERLSSRAASPTNVTKKMLELNTNWFTTRKAKPERQNPFIKSSMLLMNQQKTQAEAAI